MAHNNKRIISNSLHMYFRMILVTLVTLYTSRIVLEQLGVVDFGIYNAVGGIVLFFSFIVPTLSSSVQRFLNYEMGRGDYKKVNDVFSMSIIIHMLLALLVLLAGETLGLWFLNTQMNIPADRMFAANIILQCSIVSLITILIGIPYNALIIAKQKMSVYAYFSIITAALKLITAFLLTIATVDKLVVYAIMLMFVFVIARLNVGLYCKIKFHDVYFHWSWDWRLFKQLFSFSGWTLYGNVGNMAYTYGLNLVLNIYCGPVVNAARAISTQIQHAIDQFTHSFQTAISPQMTQSYASGEYEYVEKLFIGCIKGTFVLLALIAIPLIFEMDFVLHFWLGHYPDHTVAFSRFIILICFVNALIYPSRIIVQSTGRIRYFQIVQGTVLLITLPLSSIALSMGYEPEIVYVLSFALIIITSLWGFYIMYSQNSYMHPLYLFKSLLLGTICCIPSLFAIYFIHINLNIGLNRFTISLFASSILLLLFSYFVLMTKQEKYILSKFMQIKNLNRKK